MVVETSPEARVKALEREVEQLKHELQVAERDAELAEKRTDDAETEAHEANMELNTIAEQRNVLETSLHRHVWHNDRPGAQYCCGCGRAWPIHRHDCAFGEVL